MSGQRHMKKNNDKIKWGQGKCAGFVLSSFYGEVSEPEANDTCQGEGNSKIEELKSGAMGFETTTFSNAFEEMLELTYDI